ncbi:hypothetical protein D9619_011214 [Psilocybe cf. subviscida]|uniref:Uncharacterized protein n=1 Tax=Psilocybe cf. subviscida TaxID=2480587 RepID=A0A8H5F5D7_9AGAR|nr:hypothetical protein D9619_011214 [Psilocybe cf. subviscida]
MTSRAGLATRIALCAVLLFSALTLSAQAAPVPTHTSSIQIPPVTAPVPNAHFTSHDPEELVHLQLHSHLGSAPARGAIHVQDVHDSVHELVRRKGGGHGHAAPASHPASHPAPAQHAAAPAHHHESVAAKIRGAFHKVGEGIKHAAQKVGHFVKTTGAKIAKVGLKIVATAQKIASKAVGWLPGIGKPLGKIMEGESKGLNKASDAIHAHIGGKLGQAMHRMDKAQKVVGYIPRSYIPETFEERDFDDFEEFVERGFAELDSENIAERGMDDEEVFMF